MKHLKFKIIFIIALSFSLTSIIFASDTKTLPFLGKWEYRQLNSGSETGYDPDGEQLEIQEVDGKLVGSYFGLEREGDHGLFFTAVLVKDLQIKDAQIQFVVPARLFFTKRPQSITEASNPSKCSGNTRVELSFSGKIEKGRLLLHCDSTDNSCPDTQLVFDKGRWK